VLKLQVRNYSMCMMEERHCVGLFIISSLSLVLFLPSYLHVSMCGVKMLHGV
jgi:hypothetical protein